MVLIAGGTADRRPQGSANAILFHGRGLIQQRQPHWKVSHSKVAAASIRLVHPGREGRRNGACGGVDLVVREVTTHVHSANAVRIAIESRAGGTGAGMVDTEVGTMNWGWVWVRELWC